MYGWCFIITLKDGSLKTFQEEVGLLKGISRKRSACKADRYTRNTLEYRYLNNVDYGRRDYYRLMQIAHMIVQLVGKIPDGETSPGRELLPIKLCIN